jgi:hypothetical protein
MQSIHNCWVKLGNFVCIFFERGSFCPNVFCPNVFCPNVFCPNVFCPNKLYQNVFCQLFAATKLPKSGNVYLIQGWIFQTRRKTADKKRSSKIFFQFLINKIKVGLVSWSVECLSILTTTLNSRKIKIWTPPNYEMSPPHIDNVRLLSIGAEIIANYIKSNFTFELSYAPSNDYNKQYINTK